MRMAMATDVPTAKTCAASGQLRVVKPRIVGMTIAATTKVFHSSRVTAFRALLRRFVRLAFAASAGAVGSVLIWLVTTLG